MATSVATTPVRFGSCAASAQEADGSPAPQVICVAAHAISQRIASICSAGMEERRLCKACEAACLASRVVPSVLSL